MSCPESLVDDLITAMTKEPTREIRNSSRDFPPLIGSAQSSVARAVSRNATEHLVCKEQCGQVPSRRTIDTFKGNADI